MLTLIAIAILAATAGIVAFDAAPRGSLPARVHVPAARGVLALRDDEGVEEIEADGYLQGRPEAVPPDAQPVAFGRLVGGIALGGAMLGGILAVVFRLLSFLVRRFANS